MCYNSGNVKIAIGKNADDETANKLFSQIFSRLLIITLRRYSAQDYACIPVKMVTKVTQWYLAVKPVEKSHCRGSQLPLRIHDRSCDVEQLQGGQLHGITR